MKDLVPTAIGVIATLLFAITAALSIWHGYVAFAGTFAPLALLAGLLTHDEIKHYRTQRNKPQLQPLTQLDKT